MLRHDYETDTYLRSNILCRKTRPSASNNQIHLCLHILHNSLLYQEDIIWYDALVGNLPFVSAILVKNTLQCRHAFVRGGIRIGGL